MFVGTAWYAKKPVTTAFSHAPVRDRRVHSASQFYLDLLELRSHAITPGLALELEAPRRVGRR